MIPRPVLPAKTMCAVSYTHLLMWLGIFVGIVALVTVFSRVVGANLVGAVRGAGQVHFH